MFFDGREPGGPGRLAHLRRLLGHLAQGSGVGWWWQSPQEPVEARVRAVVAAQLGGGLLRGGWLTPYTAETIVEDAMRSGPGSRLEITVPTNVGDAGLAELRGQFAWLADRGVRVSVRRDGQPRAHYPVAAA